MKLVSTFQNKNKKRLDKLTQRCYNKYIKTKKKERK